MTLVHSRQFRLDAEAAVERYADEAGQAVALRFVDELQRLVARVHRHPASGSTRYEFLGIPGLRSAARPHFPYVVFYAQLGERVIFWRLLHGHRDIPSTLRDEGLGTDDS